MEKIKYFTSEKINNIAKAMYRDLNNQIDLRKDIIDINKSALLILDMQKFFLEDNSHAFVPSAKAIVNQIKSLAQIFKENARPIIITRHINTTDNAKQMDYWWRDILTEESIFSEIIPEFNLSNANMLIKSQYDAFYKTELDEFLQNKDVEQVVVTGVMTHLCCETTARSAFMHGYNVFFPIDGTATYNDHFHNSTLTNLAHGFANVTLINNLIKEL